jgi:hypothetical protein
MTNITALHVAQFRKVIISYVMTVRRYVCQSVWNSSDSTDRVFGQFDVRTPRHIQMKEDATEHN